MTSKKGERGLAIIDDCISGTIQCLDEYTQEQRHITKTGNRATNKFKKGDLQNNNRMKNH